MSESAGDGVQSEHATTEQLSALIDEELSEPEASAVLAHLSGCEACRGELEGLRASIRLVRALPVAVPPRSFRVPHWAARGGLLSFPTLRLATPFALRALAGVAAA